MDTTRDFTCITGEATGTALTYKRKRVKGVNAVTIIIAGQVYHIPTWIPVAAIAYRGSTFSAQLGKILIIVKRKRS